MNKNLKYWYLSFATDEDFLGACVIEARSFMHAVLESHRLKINPGGEVKGVAIPELGPLPINALLSKADIDFLDKAMEWE